VFHQIQADCTAWQSELGIVLPTPRDTLRLITHLGDRLRLRRSEVARVCYTWLRPDGLAVVSVPAETDLESEHLVLLEEVGHVLYDERPGITNGPLWPHRHHDARGERQAGEFVLAWLLPSEPLAGMTDEEVVGATCATWEQVRAWRRLSIGR
jgi:hypothetical protein